MCKIYCTLSDDAQEVITGYIDHYNTVRLHSAIGYVTSKTKLKGMEQEVFKDRDAKLETARATRKEKRRAQQHSRGVSDGALAARLD